MKKKNAPRIKSGIKNRRCLFIVEFYDDDEHDLSSGTIETVLESLKGVEFVIRAKDPIDFFSHVSDSALREVMALEKKIEQARSEKNNV